MVFVFPLFLILILLASDVPLTQKLFQQTCKALYEFTTTRPVYRNLADGLLRRCRALPLKGFQKLSDLTTEQLIHSVNKASRYEVAWRLRAPRPILLSPQAGANSHSNYMDVGDGCFVAKTSNKWYKVVSAPPNEEVDWLSPITSSYTLCATKSGKVVCWDVQTDTCLAEWNPGEKWELWKCRVEFEERTVFFTMAKVITGSYDDGRIMEFVLMKLHFSDGPTGESGEIPPTFSHVTDFKTTGVVMNVFLLDPSARLLSAFVWISSTTTVGLYVLLDWDKPEFVFIDTGIQCVMSSNWSCILYEKNIVIHCEESDAAFQHFYPISLLRKHTKQLPSKNFAPSVSASVVPLKTLTKKFIFPMIANPEIPITPATNATTNGATPPITTPTLPIPNPFPSSQWYPESAHFVRQWWPSLPGIPKVSCTVVLLASHDEDTHRTRFVLAQHYFRVPLSHDDWANGIASEDILTEPDPFGNAQIVNGSHDSNERVQRGALEARTDEALMQLWYVSTPFEVVCVLDGTDDEEDGAITDRPRPLVAVDFGHAVWIEFVENEDDRAARPEGDPEQKWLRFVTFPAFDEDMSKGPHMGLEGRVRTLQVPDELDLDSVETINIDQSQGAVILSVREGKIFILCYE
ncbi:hypothetical protein BD779DRAFT_881550 [Infundibulicybe gibba]|nr:hypothetical protein BD779DRAFT_881550 [Infundibulicybe gibba]